MSKLLFDTFMSWDEEFCGETVRAVALCDSNGYFNQAINACRDSDMGEKDENGVYSRIWYADHIESGGKGNVRIATPKEVELYLMYCNPGADLFPGIEYVGELELEDRTIGVYRNIASVSEDMTPQERKEVVFNAYINELAEYYRTKGTLKGMTTIRSKYPVTSISKEQFFECGINIAAKRGVIMERAFTDEVYAYIKNKDKNIEPPVFR